MMYLKSKSPSVLLAILGRYCNFLGTFSQRTEVKPYIVLGLALLCIQFSKAQDTEVFGWAGFWKYFDRGELPAVNWAAPEFDDGAWPERPGMFGFPENES